MHDSMETFGYLPISRSALSVPKPYLSLAGPLRPCPNGMLAAELVSCADWHPKPLSMPKKMRGEATYGNDQTKRVGAVSKKLYNFTTGAMLGSGFEQARGEERKDWPGIQEAVYDPDYWHNGVADLSRLRAPRADVSVVNNNPGFLQVYTNNVENLPEAHGGNSLRVRASAGMGNDLEQTSLHIFFRYKRCFRCNQILIFWNN